MNSTSQLRESLNNNLLVSFIPSNGGTWTWIVGGVGVGPRDENGRMALRLRAGLETLRWEALEDMLTWLELLCWNVGWRRKGVGL